jgi:hypothetical protein
VEVSFLTAQRGAWVSRGQSGGTSLSHLCGALLFSLQCLDLVVLDVKRDLKFM